MLKKYREVFIRLSGLTNTDKYLPSFGQFHADTVQT